MKKIKTLFVRDHTAKLVTPEPTPGTEAVFEGRCRPTFKWDGTSCMVRDGKFYKRYMVNKKRTPPDFEPAQDPDPVTGKQPGWVPVGEGPEDRWHREAWASHLEVTGGPPGDGTYELVGPKVQGNPHGFTGVHALLLHGGVGFIETVPLTFDELREFMEKSVIEGVIWWDDNGPVAKLKRRDFGFPWP